jgi:hypothetical protein
MFLLFACLGIALLGQTSPDTLPRLPKDANQFVRDAI